ncbi:TPA: hypothetical protein RD852_000706 [Listeria monocytogenes]|uniref:hypothetical protein n=2 Tax=Listeria TaxID=1637 RepID=UPI0024BE04BD|nr:hypothetical protein [Listeria monocytogenes]HDT8353271.1 hypothetical protein [Listeria monocytogenes]
MENLEGGGNEMTQNNIENVKFEEAKMLVQELNSIAAFNKNISLVVSVGLDSEEEFTTISSAGGNSESLLRLYINFTEALTNLLMQEHNCECNILAVVDSAATGAKTGYENFKINEKEQTNENN